MQKGNLRFTVQAASVSQPPLQRLGSVDGQGHAGEAISSSGATEDKATAEEAVTAPMQAPSGALLSQPNAVLPQDVSPQSTESATSGVSQPVQMAAAAAAVGSTMGSAISSEGLENIISAIQSQQVKKAPSAMTVGEQANSQQADNLEEAGNRQKK